MKRILLALFTVRALATAGAQQPRTFTTADYDRAAKQLAPWLATLTTGGNVAANWLSDDRMWYRNGNDVILVDPAKRIKVTCTADRANCPGVPPVSETNAQGGRGGGRGGRGGGGGRGGAAGNAVTSPDGKRAAFIKDYNLWVRDVATGQEKQLTTRRDVAHPKIV